MGYEKDLTGKATLAAEDIRFARTIDRLQRIVLSELYKIALVHLYTQGYRGETLTNFELSLTTPSKKIISSGVQSPFSNFCNKLSNSLFFIVFILIS